MPIPPLDQHGLLPAGVHDCDWQEIQQAFCWNAHRQHLFDRLQDFLAQCWVPLNIHAPMWIDGSFTRSKEQPDDIDLVADVSHVSMAQMGPVLALLFLQTNIKSTYKVDFWIKHPSVPNDLTQYFRYTGLKAGAELGLDSKRLKGILRVT